MVSLLRYGLDLDNPHLADIAISINNRIPLQEHFSRLAH